MKKSESQTESDKMAGPSEIKKKKLYVAFLNLNQNWLRDAEAKNKLLIFLEKIILHFVRCLLIIHKRTWFEVLNDQERSRVWKCPFEKNDRDLEMLIAIIKTEKPTTPKF